MAPVHGFLMLDDAAIVETYDEESEAGGRRVGRVRAHL
jgi:hypothetical protein